MQFSCFALALGIGLAVNASPYPQGVTSKVAPAGSGPSECQRSYRGAFGVAVHPLVPSKYKRAADGPVWQIGDGQPQAPIAPTLTMVPVTQIGDGQLQAPTSVPPPAVTQIGDGQIQAPTTVQPPAVTQIGDGQIQAPTSVHSLSVTQIGDGRIQAPTTITMASTNTISMVPVSEIRNGQIEASTTTHVTKSTWTSKMTVAASVASTMSTVARPASSAGIIGSESVACKTIGTLELTLADGVLIDAFGRTGYVASNRQFQFDAPPQSRAIFTAGFSACNNGSLALGSSTIWWQCPSGDFYNLYDRKWAAHCEPIALAMVNLVDC